MGRRVRVSRRHPQAAAVCDRCGLWANHVDLVPQMEWQGTRLARKGNLLVHRRCLDVPNPQLRARVIPPDGLPICDPRLEPMSGVVLTPLGTEAGAPLTDESADILIIDDVAP